MKKIFNQRLITNLEPALAGRSLRSRFHLYVDRADPGTPPELVHIPDSATPPDNLPPFFHDAPGDLVWIGEASADRATFYSLKQSSQDGRLFAVDVAQLEVENKFRPLAPGKRFLDIYQAALVGRLSATIELDSKYHLAANAIIPAAH